MKRTVFILVGLILTGVLSSAAYLGARLVTGAGAGRASGGMSSRSLDFPIDYGSGPVTVKIRVEPAPELPDVPSVASGSLVRRANNSLFVATGNVRFAGHETDLETGEQRPRLESDGPLLEVVVVPETVIYRDDTEGAARELAAQQGGQRRMRQILAPARSHDEADIGALVEVWGERRGDRIVADTIVFMELQMVLG